MRRRLEDSLTRRNVTLIMSVFDHNRNPETAPSRLSIYPRENLLPDRLLIKQ